ncbi:hypothetical protein COT69_01885 [candidate division WWE3 bacterium CG09_land_8_20_14_0_10_39_24]|uniref:Uncharacterized protein n=2 Tax=Katanobacteria TaxID=422282 RepID=A0A2H0WJI8_UNCKA|nr:MAG: hypothetical protein AUJ94_01190 [bacterium CG2_30_40_12]OJI08788.1 MAG: hypothetical protein BK003_01860 [bacterium CG09_39_24]PIS12816.1 MAG: hypothetical protein COT69_01885 [candidate division WWE3 bacterium CG09_land_8_20_14_0_10_39_24]
MGKNRTKSMTATENLNLINELTLWVVFEIATLVFLLIYALFSLLVVRQIYLMNKALITGIASYIKLIGWVHLAFALMVLFILVSTIL